MALQVLDMGLHCRDCDDVLKKERGCIGQGIVPFIFDSGIIYHCPIKDITTASWEYLQAYPFYKNGILPNGGGFNDESQKYIEAMLFLDSEFGKEIAEKAKVREHKK